jgi:hypothetical protein
VRRSPSLVNLVVDGCLCQSTLIVDDSVVTDSPDTSCCPIGARCESCGDEAGDALTVVVTECALGALCMTMCARCARGAGDLNIAKSTAARLVMQHAIHVGVTAEDMRLLQIVSGRYPWQQPRRGQVT